MVLAQPATSYSPALKEVGGRARTTIWAANRLLPVRPEVRGLFPDGGLRRGSTVVVSGSTSLVLATMAAASAEGSWCAAVGLPSLGLVAAGEAGIELDRFALVPRPGSRWAVVVAALLEAFDVVVVQPTGSVRHSDARRLAARARERDAVLLPVVADSSAWPGADVRLDCVGRKWQGLGDGNGHLSKQRLQVVAHGRGAASRQRQALVGLAAS